MSPSLAVAKENTVKALEEEKRKEKKAKRGEMNRSSWKERRGNEAVGDKISAGGDSLSKQWEGAVR